VDVNVHRVDVIDFLGCAENVEHDLKRLTLGVDEVRLFRRGDQVDVLPTVTHEHSIAGIATATTTGLAVRHADHDTHEDWNPSDFAHHLSRRARGLPFWFSLATYGTSAYTEAVEATLTTTRGAARLIDDAPHLELIMEPELSVVLFRRTGWAKEQYQAWSDGMLARGTAFVVPTSWAGETVLRICVVNPRTTLDDIALIVDSLA